MSANTSFLHRLHRGFSNPTLAGLGPLTVKLRAYYLLPGFALPLVTGSFRLSGPSNDEIMTYWGEWALGGIARDADRATQKGALEGVLSQMPREDRGWFEDGFSNGLRGRKARYDVPDDLFGEE